MYKNSLIFLIIIAILAACASSNNGQNPQLLHDIWALESIDGTAIDLDKLNKHPDLEINLTENRVSGNDGCNSLMGEITTATQDKLAFGVLAGTKMACPNMDISNQIGTHLSQVQGFKIKDLRLYLYDQAGKELLVYKKVD